MSYISTYFLLWIVKLVYTLAPVFMLFLFITLQYKTKKKDYFKYTFILYIGTFVLDCIVNVILFDDNFSIVSTIYGSVFYVCMLLISVRGISNIKYVRWISIAQIVFTGLGTLVNAIDGISWMSYRFGVGLSVLISGLLSGVSVIAFWLVILKVVPKTIETPQSKAQSIQEMLKILKTEYENGAITEEEYNQKKTNILNKL